MSKQDIGHLGIFYSKHFLTLTCNSHHMPITPFVKILPRLRLRVELQRKRRGTAGHPKTMVVKSKRIPKESARKSFRFKNYEGTFAAKLCLALILSGFYFVK